MERAEFDNKWGEQQTLDVPAPPDLLATNMAIISILMRIYDVQMAILNKMDEPRADGIFAAHEKGETFNPTIYIPDMTQVDAKNI